MQEAQSFSGCTRTVSPSMAIFISTGSMPPGSHRARSSSSSLMGREALFPSVSPAQNFLKPPPVPEKATATRTPLFAIWNSSAIASRTG
jgi:hypothetical protein